MPHLPFFDADGLAPPAEVADAGRCRRFAARRRCRLCRHFSPFHAAITAMLFSLCR
jgi:hypothetical protein